jgi:hypothetical protein
VPFNTARSVPPDKALIYIYRVSHTLGAANAYEIFANGKPITRLGNGGYYDFVTAPGQIQFAWRVHDAVSPLMAMMVNSGGPHPACTLDAEAGHTYYYIFEQGPPRMLPTFEADAIKAMADMHRYDDAQ